MKFLAPLAALALFCFAGPARGQIVWTAVEPPNGNGADGQFSDEDLGRVISYGTLQLEGGQIVQYEVVLDVAVSLNTASAPRNSFEIVDGNADLNTRFTANNAGANGDVGVTINFYENGTYTPGAYDAGLDSNAPGSGTQTNVELGIIAPNHGNFDDFKPVEQYHVDTHGNGSFTSITDDNNDIYNSDDHPADVETPLPGFDFSFGTQTNINPNATTFAINLPATTSYSIRRPGDSGANSAIGFTAAQVIPEPASAALAAAALALAGLRRRR